MVIIKFLWPVETKMNAVSTGSTQKAHFLAETQKNNKGTILSTTPLSFIRTFFWPFCGTGIKD